MRAICTFCVSAALLSACIYRDECVGGAIREGDHCVVPDAGDGMDAGTDGRVPDTGPPDADAAFDGFAGDAGEDGGPGCDGGLVHCDGACVDTTSNRDHCGSCSDSCAWQCSGGTCNEVAQLTAATSHVCVRLESGRVHCWGDNRVGQLGDGTTTERGTPAPVSGLNDATLIATHSAHTCALSASAGLLCWGFNSTSQLGRVSAFESEPVSVTEVDGATDVTVGNSFSCATVGVELRCWGENDEGSLGDGTYDSSVTPVTVLDLAGPDAVVAGDVFACARIFDDSVHCWGDGTEGQLGTGDTMSENRPQQIASFDAVELTAGRGHVCARRSDDTVWCWGDNTAGQVTGVPGDAGDAVSTPSQITGVTDAAGIAAGAAHVCVLHAGGTVSCQGSNASGQLGDGTTDARTGLVSVMGLDDAVAISSGQGDFTCARRATGDLVCWGANFSGMLGDGTTEASAAPVAVLPP